MPAARVWYCTHSADGLLDILSGLSNVLQNGSKFSLLQGRVGKAGMKRQQQ